MWFVKEQSNRAMSWIMMTNVTHPKHAEVEHTQVEFADVAKSRHNTL
ncbi:MAG: hypothetical protein OQK51_14560 [Kangiellaceae bacterium]|nr:hypothetical protein [Kangiellaceae bacterium]